MKIVSYLMIIGVCVISILFVVYISFLTFYPFNVIQVKNAQELPVNKSVYLAGEQINITFDYTKYLDIAPRVKKEVVCDKSVTELTEFRRLPFGRGVVQLAHNIPLATPTDNHCRIFIFLEYEVNPLQVQRMTLRTQEFKVVNDKL